ncbi:MAG: hypothetical protein GY749_42365 [Desulfobacteraceae bacterium]|nr:hypothetical protein [Desulfobacteraceae bacterium]
MSPPTCGYARYYLHPVEEEWNTKTPLREAGYNDLPPDLILFIYRHLQMKEKKRCTDCVF